MTDSEKKKQKQSPQVVHGPQTNIDGDVHGPVLSGNFERDVVVNMLIDVVPDWPRMVVFGIGTGIVSAVIQTLVQSSIRRKENLKAEKARPSELSPPDQDATLEKNIEFLSDFLSVRKDAQKDLRSLVQTLGSDQLAIKLAGCYLKQFTDLTINDYLKKWRQVLDDLLSDERLDGINDEIQVVATIALNWEQVESESARYIFWVAGYCSPNHLISSQLLQISTNLESEAYEQSLQELISFGLLEPDRENDGCLISPILAVFSRNSYLEPLVPLSSLINAFITLMSDSSTLPLQELPHAETVFAAAEEYLTQSREYLPRKFRRAYRIDILSYCQELQSLFLSGLIALYVRQGDIIEAQKLAHKALKLSQNMGNQYGMALILGRLSEVASVWGDCTQSLEYSQQSYDIFQELADQRGIAWVHLKLSDIASMRSDYHRAIEHGQRSLVIFRELADERGVAWVHLKLSDIESMRGDYHRALEHGQQSLVIFRELADERGVAWVHLKLSDIESLRGDYHRAFEHGQRSLDIFQKFADQWGTVLAYHKESRAWRLLGKDQKNEKSKEWLEKSRRHLNQALEIATETGILSLIPDLQAELGRVFRDMGYVKSDLQDIKKGLPFYKESEKQLRKALTNERWSKVAAADIWHDLAQVLYALGNLADVQVCLDEAECIIGARFVIKPGEYIPDMEILRNECGYLGKAEAFRGKIALDEGRLDQGFRHFIVAYIYFTLSPQRFDFKYLYALIRDLPFRQLAESLDTAMKWADQTFGEVRMHDFWFEIELLTGGPNMLWRESY